MSAQKYILWFKDINKHDLSSVGGKGANLGEMVSFEISVPPGFVVTTDAYFYFLEHNKLRPKLEEILEKIEKDRPESFTRASDLITKLILKAKMPQDLAIQIMKAYLDLGYPSQSLVAVRSSATAEDLPGASFAGQQETFLNVKGEANVVKKVQECWSSLFSARAIFYRDQQKVNHMRTGIAVPIQKMIQSESSGVMFTIDPMTNEKNKVVIEAIFGLGELIVQGSVTPDHYVVNKSDLEIETKNIAQQTFQLIRTDGKTFERKIPKSQQNRQKITNKQIVELARLGKKIHGHYFFPQDIEWAVENNKIYILQTRPVTTAGKNHGRAASDKASEDMQKEKREVILSGSPASPGIATGQVRIIHSPSEISKIKNGEILVTTRTTPDFVPAMKKAAAIVTDQGGQTSHAAIVSRELGVPCVVGTEKATSILKTGQYITVNSQIGEVYNATPYDMNSTKMETLAPASADSSILSKPIPIKTATKVYVNLAEPELASIVAKKNVDGVGLLRAEFMMAEIGVHPRK
ncbi:MAG: phosphoenolpyruvate synthase, partial [bacterium]|nr:phosphoenolpyruvate synthase [bacterium]